jgi:hypothetical protein
MLPYINTQKIVYEKKKEKKVKLVKSTKAPCNTVENWLPST